MHDDIHTHAKLVIELAIAKQKTIGCAESCTGGWIGKALTEIPGSSAAFSGGLITYSNEVKHSLLGIPLEILEFYGAVSEPTAGAMAQQTRDMLSVDLAVSVTGIAGPSGRSAQKPVGMVCFGLSERGEKPLLFTEQFGDIGRENIRIRSVCFALNILYKSLGG